MKTKSSISQFSKLSLLAVLGVLCVLWAPKGVSAKQGGDFGAGIVVGLPTGISGKLWLGQTNALDFILGMDFNENWVAMNADYVWHNFSIFQVPQGQLPLYYGMGPWVSVANSSAAVGGRGVIGIEYLFANAPLDAFFEIAPGISILPGTHFNMGAGLGMRYFF